jgi:dolichol-phosphate mannosyltransferase
MKRRSLTIVAPVYNERQIIGDFHRRVSFVLQQLSSSFDAKILFVVDRSSDGTLELLRNIAAQDSCVQIVSLSSRFGHQMSLLAGIDCAKEADLIIMMDSDLQHPPEIIPVLLREHDKGSDIVYTVRTDTVGGNTLRKAAGDLFYRLLGYLSRVPIRKNAADFCLISRRVANVFRNGIRERNMFLRGLLSWVGFTQSAVEFKAEARGGGESKYTLSRTFGLAASAILSFSIKPLQVGIFLGLSVAALSVLLMALTVVKYFIDKSIPSGWSTLAILILLFSGVQLTMMGILGAYIGGIYEEVKGRPHYIIDETVNVSYE